MLSVIPEPYPYACMFYGAVLMMQLQYLPLFSTKCLSQSKG